jgi:hypothetical protein
MRFHGYSIPTMTQYLDAAAQLAVTIPASTNRQGAGRTQPTLSSQPPIHARAMLVSARRHGRGTGSGALPNQSGERGPRNVGKVQGFGNGDFNPPTHCHPRRGHPQALREMTTVDCDPMSCGGRCESHATFLEIPLTGWPHGDNCPRVGFLSAGWPVFWISRG